MKTDSVSKSSSSTLLFLLLNMSLLAKVSIREDSFFQSQKVCGKWFKEERILKKILISVLSSEKVLKTFKSEK